MPALPPDEARRRAAAGRVARLATVGADGQPHLVPITFALDGDWLVTAVDAKPKRHRRLRRLDNIAANPRVSVLIDHYADDWSQLWWVRLDGTAAVLTDGDTFDRALGLLAARYPAYRQPPPGPVIAVDIDDVTGWAANATG